VAFDTHRSHADLLGDRKLWEQSLINIRSRAMPPEDKKKQPTLAERELLQSWIDYEVFKCDCKNPDPGRVTLRRLNRAEYNNTIRDLVGVNFRPADDFPADDAGYGFDNIGDVLSMPPPLYAPPQVIPGNSSTTGGRMPCARQKRASSSCGSPGCTCTRPLAASSAITPSNSDTSSVPEDSLYVASMVRLEA